MKPIRWLHIGAVCWPNTGFSVEFSALQQICLVVSNCPVISAAVKTAVPGWQRLLYQTETRGRCFIGEDGQEPLKRNQPLMKGM